MWIYLLWQLLALPWSFVRRRVAGRRSSVWHSRMRKQSHRRVGKNSGVKGLWWAERRKESKEITISVRGSGVNFVNEELVLVSFLHAILILYNCGSYLKTCVFIASKKLKLKIVQFIACWNEGIKVFL